MQLSPQAQAATPSVAPETASDYIVVLKDDVADARPSAAEHSRRYQTKVGHIYNVALKGYSASMTPAQVRQLKNDRQVASVSVDKPMKIAAQTLPSGINRIEADRSTTRSGNNSGATGVAIAIIDTGSGPHNDLNVVGGKNCTTESGWSDGNGHGTHVAGIAAARDDYSGVVGVAPRAPIYSVRSMKSDGSGSLASVICGIDWVTANAAALKIKVANMSIEGGGTDDGNCGRTNGDLLHQAICRSTAKGVTYVVAAGNSAKNFSSTIPAAYREVLTVTAMTDYNGRAGGGATSSCSTDKDDTGADYSNFTTVGSRDSYHTVAAPGTCIRSTWIGSTKTALYTTTGTSMAAPHVTGMVALCFNSGKCAGLTPSQVVAKIAKDSKARTTAVSSYGYGNDPVRPNGTRYYGYLAYAGAY